MEAWDGAHAPVCLNERPDIDAVFTDVNMPRPFDGVRLACVVGERRPDVVIVVTCGAMALGAIVSPPDAVSRAPCWEGFNSPDGSRRC